MTETSCHPTSCSLQIYWVKQKQFITLCKCCMGSKVTLIRTKKNLWFPPPFGQAALKVWLPWVKSLSLDFFCFYLVGQWLAWALTHCTSENENFLVWQENLQSTCPRWPDRSFFKSSAANGIELIHVYTIVMYIQILINVISIYKAKKKSKNLTERFRH